MKTLGLAVLLASPAVAAWALRGGEEPSAAAESGAPAVERVAVELVAADGKKEWMMVEFPPEAVPEPASALLLMLSTLLLLRRNRGK
jgi:hypothetical protein